MFLIVGAEFVALSLDCNFVVSVAMGGRGTLNVGLSALSIFLEYLQGGFTCDSLGGLPRDFASGCAVVAIGGSGTRPNLETSAAFEPLTIGEGAFFVPNAYFRFVWTEGTTSRCTGLRVCFFSEAEATLRLMEIGFVLSDVSCALIGPATIWLVLDVGISLAFFSAFLSFSSWMLILLPWLNHTSLQITPIESFNRWY